MAMWRVCDVERWIGDGKVDEYNVLSLSKTRIEAHRDVGFLTFFETFSWFHRRSIRRGGGADCLAVGRCRTMSSRPRSLANAHVSPRLFTPLIRPLSHERHAARRRPKLRRREEVPMHARHKQSCWRQPLEQRHQSVEVQCFSNGVALHHQIHAAWTCRLATARLLHCLKTAC